MKNLGSLMKQAQQMQSRMAEIQQKLAESEYTGQAAGGMVSVTLTGKSDRSRAKKASPAMTVHLTMTSPQRT